MVRRGRVLGGKAAGLIVHDRRAAGLRIDAVKSVRGGMLGIPRAERRATGRRQAVVCWSVLVRSVWVLNVWVLNGWLDRGKVCGPVRGRYLSGGTEGIAGRAVAAGEIVEIGDLEGDGVGGTAVEIATVGPGRS